MEDSSNQDPCQVLQVRLQELWDPDVPYPDEELEGISAVAHLPWETAMNLNPQTSVPDWFSNLPETEDLEPKGVQKLFLLALEDNLPLPPPNRPWPKAELALALYHVYRHLLTATSLTRILHLTEPEN
jgi:hypothetical protein